MTKETFTDLVLKSEQTLYSISMSMLKNPADCEDAVQTAILTAYEKLDTLRHEKYFRTWLVRILINVCNKSLNDRKKIINIEEYSNSAEPSVPSGEKIVEVRMALEALPVKIRQTMVLFYIEEFTITEIKEILRIPEGTVKSRLSKGRQLMREKLDDYPACLN